MENAKVQVYVGNLNLYLFSSLLSQMNNFGNNLQMILNSMGNGL